MRLLLTRAAEDAARTRARLEAAGHDVLVSPVIEIRATCDAWPGGVVDAIVATSAQAFARLANGPAPEARRLLPLFLVGEKTAAAAREAGFLGATITVPNAAALGAVLPASGRALYLAGVDRKAELEDAARDGGLALEVFEVYQAAPLTGMEEDVRMALSTLSVAGVLHFSRRSADLFLAGLSDAGLDAKSLRHFCLSDDVAGPLREAGCGEVHIANAPNEAAMLALLRVWPGAE